MAGVSVARRGTAPSLVRSAQRHGGGAEGGIPDMEDMWNSVEDTNFPERASRIAKIIEQQQPHIICLQEVARWHREEVIGGDDDTDGNLSMRGRGHRCVGAVVGEGDGLVVEAPDRGRRNGRVQDHAEVAVGEVVAERVEADLIGAEEHLRRT